MSKKKKDWKTEKERLLHLSLDDRRKEYRRQDFISLDKILTWREKNRCDDQEDGKEVTGRGGLSDKVSLYKGDITVLEVDAIVNADVSLEMSAVTTGNSILHIFSICSRREICP
uniref:Macro domain-containing protein n=1 Tax=Haplochromis burtoni TaxID=8153 RepID=A0A3Q2W2C4_HAPBU